MPKMISIFSCLTVVAVTFAMVPDAAAEAVSGDALGACVGATLDGGRTAAFQAATASLRPLWRVMHWVGYGPAYLFLVFAFAVGVHWRRARDFAVAVGLVAWTIGCLKAVFHAPRPGWVDETLWVDMPAQSAGFPSGHAATVLCLLLLVRTRWAVLGVATGCAVMAASRVGVGAHGPEQVLAGVVVGTIGVVAAPMVVRWMNGRLAPRALFFAASLGLASLIVCGWVSGVANEALCHPGGVAALEMAAVRGVGGGLGLALGALLGVLLMPSAPRRGRWLAYGAAVVGGCAIALPAPGASAMAINFAAMAGVWGVVWWVRPTGSLTGPEGVDKA